LFDILFDIGSAIWDVVEIVKNPTSGWAWGSLGADVACAFVPFVAGGGVAVRGAKAVNAIDNAADAAKAANRGTDAIQGISKLDDAARAVDRSSDYARTIDRAGEVGRAAKASERSSKAIVIGENMKRVRAAAKKLGAEVFEGTGMDANKSWLKSKLMSGYKVYDIGPDFERRVYRMARNEESYSRFYNMERLLTTGYGNTERLWQRQGKYLGGSPLVDHIWW